MVSERGPVRTAVIKWSEKWPLLVVDHQREGSERRKRKGPRQRTHLVIHFFMPLTIQCLPSGESVPVVVMPCTSDPACGSEMASEMNFLPLVLRARARRGQLAWLLEKEREE